MYPPNKQTAKQFEFIDGGIVQHDQANPTANDIINHMTFGHRFLLETFGVRPSVGWSIVRTKIARGVVLPIDRQS